MRISFATIQGGSGFTNLSLNIGVEQHVKTLHSSLETGHVCPLKKGKEKMWYILIVTVICLCVVLPVLALIGPAIIREVKLLIHDFHWFGFF